MLRQTQEKQILHSVIKKEYPNLCANVGLPAVLSAKEIDLYALQCFYYYDVYPHLGSLHLWNRAFIVYCYALSVVSSFTRVLIAS